MDLAGIARLQCGVVTTAQAKASGLTQHAVDWRVCSGRWRRLHRGVLLTHSGDPDWMAQASAAVLACGEGAALCFTSAAHVLGVQAIPPERIHVAVPRGQRSLAAKGVRVHERSRLVLARGPAWPPRTSVEETVLDLGSAGSLNAAVAHAARAVQLRLTTADRIADALRERRRHRWRDGLRLALGDIGDGAESTMEVRYVSGVERPHRLPPSRRQAPGAIGAHRLRRDFEYDDYLVVVEVDGRLGHAGAGMWADRRRDRKAAREGRLTLRAGWVDVTYEPCELAQDVGLTLVARGWRGPVVPCSDDCPVNCAT